jgi:uncharacterized protein YecE (DUF72 family)
MARALHIGCSGWQYRSWRDGAFYPPRCAQRNWLSFYSGEFETVEVNSTFYRLAKPEAVARWVTETPPDFVFTVKASRYLTHIRRLRDITEGIERYFDSIRPLVESPKLGPVLWQLPPNFKRDDEKLRYALGQLPAGRHCFEFRHETWFVPDVYEMLREFRVALVIGDHPQRPWQAHEMTADWTFVRFHYGARGRRGNYSKTELETWAKRIEQWRRRVEVFIYFNNDWEGFAIQNGRWLKRRLGV